MMLNERFKAARIAAGLSQRQLAKATGDIYSAAYISRIESGDREPSIRALIRFAAPMGVSPIYLLSGQEDICPVCLRGGE